MATDLHTIHLVVPGLLGPMPTFSQLGDPLPCPILERLLSRSRVTSYGGTDVESVLCGLFGITVEERENLPTAAYRRLGDGGDADDRYWLQLTPVYLRPDQDRLLLFDAEDLQLTAEEAQAFAQLFNSHFTEEGWQVEVRHPHRWYFSLPSTPSLKTYELADVFGRNMDMFLPEGEQGIRWHGVLNEIQMLFYAADINSRREDAGKGPVSGLWLSGGGKLSQPVQTHLTTVYGDTPLLRGLAMYAGSPPLPLPERSEELLDRHGELLVCYDRLQRSVLCADPFGWKDQVLQFENWMQPLADAIKAKRLHALQLYPCNGYRYQVDRGGLRRFWRRSLPLAQQLDSNQLR
ncbi:hypothetical protein [Sedimenticola sp.]|uniref:hypothetical protein n=1 Tax=Sedimenticola sp. TaxID=1940285 RepID=UPI003D122917